MKKPKIDQGKCIGCGLCANLTNDKVFRINDEGKAEIYGGCEGWEGCDEKVAEAIESCPVQAISWETAPKGKK